MTYIRSSSDCLICAAKRLAAQTAAIPIDMHELSVCQAMLDQVECLAAQHGADYVAMIDVEIGALSGVDAFLLTEAFEVMKRGTCASAAHLNTRSTAIAVVCNECGAKTMARANDLTCQVCSGFRTSVVEGSELRLRDVKLGFKADALQTGGLVSELK